MDNVVNRKDTGATNGKVVINVGSRNSQLALIQTNQVITKLENFYVNNPDRLHQKGIQEVKFNIVSMTTTGDQILDKPLPEIGAKSLFTRELETALLERAVDFVVHSLKDLPTTLPNGCVIGAVMERDDPNDVLVLKKSLVDRIKPLDLLLKPRDQIADDVRKMKMGTSSQRRTAMIRKCNSKIECVDIRGNLNTRLKKLDEDDGVYAAIILARAGLDRMGWSDRASETLSPSTDSTLVDWHYAVGQGAIAVECRARDVRILDLIMPISNLKTTMEVVAERALMRKLEGGCSVPLGVRSHWSPDGTTLTLSAIVSSLDGQHVVRASGEAGTGGTSGGDLNGSELTGIVEPSGLDCASKQYFLQCAQLGVDVANRMIDSGCLRLMKNTT